MTCPLCDLAIRPSNFNRHWANQHPGEPIPEKRLLSRGPHGGGSGGRGQLDNSTPTESPQFEFVHYSDEDEIELDGDIVVTEVDDENGQASLLTRESVQAESTSCGYPGCGYAATTKRELASHRRKMGHPKPKKVSHVVDEDEEEENADNANDDDVIVNTSVDKSADNSMDKSVDRSTPSVGRGFKDLKYKCDTPNCTYVSRYRQNLDRHCKSHSHYSKLIINTSKIPREDMVKQMRREEERRKSKESPSTAAEGNDTTTAPAEEENEVPVDPLVEGASEELMEVDEEVRETITPDMPVDEIEDEIEAMEEGEATASVDNADLEQGVTVEEFESVADDAAEEGGDAEVEVASDAAAAVANEDVVHVVKKVVQDVVDIEEHNVSLKPEKE